MPNFSMLKSYMPICIITFLKNYGNIVFILIKYHQLAILAIKMRFLPLNFLFCTLAFIIFICYNCLTARSGLSKCRFAFCKRLPYIRRDLKKEVMTMYAVIKTGGKQYRVQKGDTIFVEKLDVQADSEYTFDTVLAVGEDGSVKTGTPTVSGATVKGKVVKNGKGKKLNILRYRPKKGSMRKMGHRQPYTKIEITEIIG